MSTTIPISSLSEDKYKELVKILTHIPGSKEAEKKKKWKFGKSIPQGKKTPIPIFQLDYENDQTVLRIPFRFACGYLGKMVNREIDFPKVQYKFGISLRDYQIEIVQEAYTQLYTYATTNLSVFTGAGKTIMSAYLLSLMGLKACVFINLQALINSWYNTFTTCFPELKDRIWIVGEGPAPEDPCLIICMTGRYEKIPDHIKDGIGCAIFDEAHLLCTQSMIPMLLSLKPKYIIACSATMDRDDSGEIIMQAIVGNHCVERISQKPFKVYKLMTKIKIEEVSGKFGLDYSKFSVEQSKNVERNVEIINIMHGNPTNKFMIFCKTKEHVETLGGLCQHYGISYDTFFGVKKKFKEARALICSVSKAGTGFDMKTFIGEEDFSGEYPDTLILASTIKSIPKLTQVLGRVLRHDNPKLIYMVDNNAITKRHFNEAKDMFARCKGKLIEVEYNPEVPGGGVKL